MDKPNGTYALGVFCTFVRPYVSGESRGISTQKKGFMKDFFDVILESSATDTSDVNKRHYSKAKTAINEGVWAGINQTDLVKFFNGCRKLPQWKASEFFQHLDKARVESLFDDIGIDALSQFQRCLGQVNIKAPSIDKLPSAVSTWLFEILEANADNRDLLVDGTAFQPEFELLDDLPLAEGHISSGKLHLGRSAVAWRKSPSPPESPDFNVERTYLAQMESAYAEHLHRQIRSRDDLPDRQRKEYDRQRGYFYNAEGLRRNMRDVIDDGETEFHAMKDDLYDGVCDVCNEEYDDGLARMLATLNQAAILPLSGSVITRFPTIVKAAEKKGICYMLVNDTRLEWVSADE